MKSFLHKGRPLSIMAAILGVALFTTAAFADLVSGSPYANLKGALKDTALHLTDDAHTWSNYTLTSMYSVTLDNQLMERTEQVSRTNAQQELTELQTIRWDQGKETSTIEITDLANQQLLHKSSKDDAWVIYENYPAWNIFSSSSSGPIRQAGMISSTVSEVLIGSRSADLERIVDSAVGNLASMVQSEQLASGDVRYYGTVISGQMPPLLQALFGLSINSLGVWSPYTTYYTDTYDTSLAIIGGADGPVAVYVGSGTVEVEEIPFTVEVVTAEGTMPLLEQNIRVGSDNRVSENEMQLSFGSMSITQITGEAWQNTEGWIYKVEGSLHFSAVDTLGQSHTGQIQFGFNLDSFGSTVITLPDFNVVPVRIEQYNSYRPMADFEVRLQPKQFGHYTSQLLLYDEDMDMWIVGCTRDVYLTPAHNSVHVLYTETWNPDVALHNSNETLEFTISNSMDDWGGFISDEGISGYMSADNPGLLNFWLDDRNGYELTGQFDVHESNWHLVFGE